MSHIKAQSTNKSSEFKAYIFIENSLKEFEKNKPNLINSPLLIYTAQTAFYDGVIDDFEVCKTLNITLDKLETYI